MNKKAIKKIIAFVKMLKAPSQMMPYIISLVITVIRRITDDDKAALVNLKEQGFVCRKSLSVPGGCGSPSVAVTSDGKVHVVFSCSRILNGALVYSLCYMKGNEPEKISGAAKRFLLDSPLQLGNVTATATPYGLLVSWRSVIPARLHLPSHNYEQVSKSLKINNAALYSALTDEEKLGGVYYAFVPDDGEKTPEIRKAPCNVNQSPVMISDNEVLWMGENEGAAVAYISTDKCKTFIRCGAVPAIPGGRTVSQVSCAKLKNGRLICIFSSQGELFISYSDDMGKRWSLPHMLNVRGTNPNLCQRADGVMALTYVQPDKKVSIRSRLSLDGQYKWLEERVFALSTADNCRRPYTAELDGKFYTVSRQRFAGEKESSIVFSLWSPHPDDEALIKETLEAKKEK